MTSNIKAETRAVADQHSAGTSIRILKNGHHHEVGPLSWQDTLRYQRMEAERNAA